MKYHNKKNRFAHIIFILFFVLALFPKASFAAVGIDVTTLDNSGGDFRSILMSGSSTRMPDIVTTASSATFSVYTTGSTPPPMATDWRCRGNSTPVAHPGAPGDTTASVPSLTCLQIVDGNFNNALTNGTAGVSGGGMHTDYRTTIAHDAPGNPAGQAILQYLSAAIRIDAEPKSIINVGTTGCASGGTWTIQASGGPTFSGASNTVSPSISAGGTNYTITVNSTPNPATGYTITNSLTGTGNSMVVQSGTTQSFTINWTCPPAPLSAPTGLTATPGLCGTNAVTLNWTGSSGATLYKIYRAGVQIGSTASTNYTDTTGTPGQTYAYTVRASDGTTDSADSNSASSIVPYACTATITLVGITGPCPAQVDLSWNAVSGATSYNIYRDGTFFSTVTGSTIISSSAAGSSHTYFIRPILSFVGWEVFGQSNTVTVVSSGLCNTPPTVTSPTATSITTTGATLGADVTSLGVPASISAKGTCFSTTVNPSLTNGATCATAAGLTTGVFTHARTGMSAGTLYHYRGYATNAAGTGYSADATFTTVAPAVPTVISPTATSIVSNGATLGANVTSLGIPATISARGTCWDVTPAPTANCTAASGVTTGVYTHVRSGMNPSTTYFYRGYATNSTGTGYSPDSSFTTPAAPAVPSVPTGLAASAGTCSTGTISVTWNASSGATSYTLRDGATTIYTGAATSFSHTGLVAGSAHSYTVSATNANGSSAFSASVARNAPAACAVPTVISPTATAVTTTGATLGANVSSLGIPATISARGTCWGTTPAPVTNCTAAAGLTTGVFTHARTGMTTNTTYYYRGYATNSTGTGYSPDGTFVTSASNATINVTSNNASATWTINPGGIAGSGLSQSHTVTPAACAGGTSYTILPGAISGYTSAVTPSSTQNVCPGGTISFTITYTAVAAFNYSLSAAAATITQASTASVPVTLTYTSGTAEGVNIAFSGLPSGVTVSGGYANQGCTPTCTITANLSATAGATTGTPTITITGTSVSTGVVKTTTFPLTVSAPSVSSVVVVSNPSTAVVGQTVTWTATALPACGTGYTYTWTGTDIPGGSTGSSNTYTFTYQTTGTKSVTATATCASASNSGSGSMLVNVKPAFKPF